MASPGRAFQWSSLDEERRWEQEGLQLAYELQNELPDIEISYANDTDQDPCVNVAAPERKPAGPGARSNPRPARRR
jgi:hypothetical protein